MEYFLNTLRLIEGTSANLFEARTGLPLETVSAALEQLRSKQLLSSNPFDIGCSPLGFRHLNRVLEAF